MGEQKKKKIMKIRSSGLLLFILLHFHLNGVRTRFVFTEILRTGLRFFHNRSQYVAKQSEIPDKLLNEPSEYGWVLVCAKSINEQIK